MSQRRIIGWIEALDAAGVEREAERIAALHRQVAGEGGIDEAERLGSILAALHERGLRTAA